MRFAVIACLILAGCSSHKDPSVLLSSTVTTPHSVTWVPDDSALELAFECEGAQKIRFPAAAFTKVSCPVDSPLNLIFDFVREGLLQMGAGVLIGRQLNE